MVMLVLSFVCDRLWRIGWLALKLLFYMTMACLLMRLIALALS